VVAASLNQKIEDIFIAAGDFYVVQIYHDVSPESLWTMSRSPTSNCFAKPSPIPGWLKTFEFHWLANS
jgi:hypothetical protein